MLEIGGLTKNLTFFSFIFTVWNHIKIFYKTEIVQLSAITTEWPYPKKTMLKKTFGF